MHVGIKSTGFDGREYRSDLEKRFSDKFLFDKYHYEYEQPYNDNSRRTCDFYVPIFDLWIEVVPYNTELFDFRPKVVIPEKIFLLVDFHEKEIVRKSGAKWDNENKKWYILKVQLCKFNTEKLKGFLPKFTDDVPVFINQEKQEYNHFREYYDTIMIKKETVEKNGGIFCTIHESDLGYDTLLHILQSKGFDGWKFIRIAEHVKFDKVDKLVTAEFSRRVEEKKSNTLIAPRKKIKKKTSKTTPAWQKKMNDTERLARLKKFKDVHREKIFESLETGRENKK